MMFGLTPEEKDLLYRTVAAEAGGESALGQQGVVHTILNRTRSDRYPGSVGEVIRQQGQFSALNHLTGYAGGKGATPRFFKAGYKVNPSVVQNVDAVLAGDTEDPTGGALNYYNPAAASPKWGPGMANPITIGAHRFGTAGGKMDPINARINQGFFDDEEFKAGNARPTNLLAQAPGAGMGGGVVGTSEARPQGGLGGIFNENRQALMGLGLDLIRRGMDTRRGFTGRGMLRGTLADQRRREIAAQKQQAAEQRNMTAELIARERPDIAEMVRTGGMPLNVAYQEFLKSGPKPELREVGDKLYQVQDGQASLVPGIDYGSQSNLFGGLPEEQFKGESGLRKEYTPLIKNIRTAAQGYDKVRRAAEGGTAADDLALIFGFMKTLDPTSTVRESEFANAENAAGVPEVIRNVWNRAKEGTRLTPEQRQNFVTTAENQWQAYRSQWQRINEQYTGLAEQYKFDPSRIVTPITEFEPIGGSDDVPQMNEQDIAESQANAIAAIQAGKDPAFVIQKLQAAGVPIPVELEQSIMYRGQ